MEVKKYNISQLKPYENNAKIHTEEQIEQIKESIIKFGMNDPIAIWGEDNIIVEGHGRLEALKKLGYKEVNCIRLDHLNNEERKAYTLIHNKLTMNTDFDFDLLSSEIEDIENINMENFGFDLNLDIDEAEEKEIIEDEVPSTSEIAQSKLGDIYQLGEHRLICGDSINPKTIEKLMNCQKADTVFTDPPYDFNECEYNKSIEDNIQDANVFIMNDDENMIRYLRKSNLQFKSFFVANFGFASPRGNNPYLQHILISHEIKGKAKNNQNLGDGFRSIIKMEYRGKLKDEKTEHKHQKSIKFITDFLRHYSATKVLDLFGGSGSTLIACEQLGIKCFISELNPVYVDLIINRWEKFTGKKAKKIQEGEENV